MEGDGAHEVHGGARADVVVGGGQGEAEFEDACSRWGGGGGLGVCGRKGERQGRIHV